MSTIAHHDVLVIDYGVGNHQSVLNTLDYLGYSYALSSSKKDIANARSYILPGVGAFAEAMGNLTRAGIIDVLSKEVLENRKPILGICLGMQVFAEDSTENGLHKGLGWMRGHIVRVPAREAVRVPHVGWNQLVVQKRDPLFGLVPDGSRFYFDHSYHFETETGNISATCDYGHGLTAAVQHQNLFGVQFHPEKSQTHGLRLLRGFVEHAKRQSGGGQ